MVESSFQSTAAGKRCHDFLPARLVVAIMAFLACWINYMLRINITVAIIAMTPPVESAQSDPECVVSGEAPPHAAANATHVTPDHGPRYDWSPDVTYAILSAYFWGNVWTCFPGGLLADAFGGRRVVLFTTLATGLLTLVLPTLADLHWGLVVACRFLIGFFGGPCWPSLHSLFSKWAPPDEKSKFIWSLFGGVFSTIVTLPLGGVIVESIGWPVLMYITGSLTVAWCAYWWYLVYDSPDQHPRISHGERAYINTALASSTGGKRPRFPARRVASSLPFWILVVAHFGNLWGLFFLQSMAPKYMNDVLGFNIKQSAGLASLPYAARMLFGLVFSYASDWLLSSHTASTWTVRRWFTISSHLIPGVLLASMGFTGCNPALSVALMTLSLGANGASTITNLVNQHDLAPNFAGTLYGIMNTFGTMAGGLSPFLVNFITRERSGLQEWRTIMGIVGAVYCVTGALFMALGTADKQAWNDPGQGGCEAPGDKEPPAQLEAAADDDDDDAGRGVDRPSDRTTKI